MRKNRVFIEGAYYHVTSRTNDKIRVFENRLGRKIMLITLEEAKEKFRFYLANFCVMPTHIHLLIKPAEGTSLSKIMQWVKTHSARRWNCIHGSTDHLWGERYFARDIKDTQEYEFVMNYIDQNPVVAGLAPTPAEWKAGGAYYKAHNITGLVDFKPFDRKPFIKLLSPIPPIVSKLMPQAQLGRILSHFGAYAETIDNLYGLIPTIPRLGESACLREAPIYLHYFTGTVDYFIYEYDGEDTMYGMVRNCTYPFEAGNCRFSLSDLKMNYLTQLDLSWWCQSLF